ncbi:glycosyl transferase group 1 [Methanobacterium lacus]|uniref:Glycosyl transferase group 1 n=1 Tax=Methanobacterium lacus (strain AL-21) TaxID=877455 RepID=F0TC70_METLA|nr:glycosyltransferase family 4 protein [Methanobacterium lacus]ADZ09221.1 glycosyl transferase group 1 [Methanobacterium lacus]
MDIGIVHPELIYPRGAEKQLCKLSYHLNKMGNNVTIYTFEKNDNYIFDPLLENIEIISLNKKWAVNYLFGFNNVRWNQMIKKLASKIGDHDVINAHNHPAQWISSYTETPTVWMCNEPYYYGGSKLNNYFLDKDRQLSSNVKLTLAFNQRMKDIIREMYPDNKKMELTGSGVDLERKIQHENNEYFDSIFVGPLYPRKRQLDIIKAFGKIKDRIPNSRLHFVGGEVGILSKKYKRTLIQTAAEYQVDIMFYDSISDEELYKLYDTADISVFVPEYEPWGIFPLETILGGITTIISDECGVKEVLPDDSMVVETGNIEELSNKILDVHENMEHYRNWTKKASKLIAEEYSWKAYAKRMENFFKNVITD